MATRPLPPNTTAPDGASVVDDRAYLRLAVAALGAVDVDALDEAGKVAYAQALAQVSAAASLRRVRAGVEECARALSAWEAQRP